MMSIRFVLSLPLVLLLASTAQAQIYPPFAPALGTPPAPPENLNSAAKAILGKALFWDEQLSSDNTIACGTCHIPAAGGVDPRTAVNSVHPGLNGILGDADDKRASRGVIHTDLLGRYVPETAVGFGFDSQVTERQSMSHIGAAFYTTTFWDGRGSGNFLDPVTGLSLIATGGALESQAVGPILNSVEMARPGRTWIDVVNKLSSVQPLALAWALPPDLVSALAGVTSYGPLFTAAFTDPAITPDRIAFALATYMRTQHPDQTPFDLGTMTAFEQLGADIFLAKGCNSCHTAPFFSNLGFQNIGLRPVVEDAGRGGGAFKNPSLRNVGLRPAFFHNGDPSKRTLRSVLNHYAAVGIVGPWAAGERAPLVAFLRRGLTDPRVAVESPPFDRPKLNSERSPSAIQWIGTATLGAGGVRPSIIADTPPLTGSPEFKLGIHGGEGAQIARLQRLNPSTGLWGNVTGPIVLSGLPGTPGAGFATIPMPIPAIPGMVGVLDSFRWRVFGSTGVCRTQTATVRYL